MVRRFGIEPDLTEQVQHPWPQPESVADDDEVLAVNRNLALQIADVIADTPAANTRVIDVHRVSSIADYFVICAGENERQLRAILREVTERMDEAGHQPRRTEGSTLSGWILLDYGDVIVHIFDVIQREFYRLDELYRDAPTLLAIQ